MAEIPVSSSSSPTSGQLAREVVNELIAHGVGEAVLAPGSRSAPLALALHAADQHGLIRLHVRVDEREAGFLALGLARRAHLPVPVVTTSGTAVANLHPAMLEALHAGVPVIALTADRPSRLRGTGANQTTDQRHIFGHIPYTDSIDGLCGSLAARKAAHLNIEFDDPLLEPGPWRFAPAHARMDSSERAIDERALIELDPAPRTVVIAGDDAGPRARIVAREAGWPLLAEPSSGARTGDALTSYRLLLTHSPLAEQIERVVSFGHATLSRPVTALLARQGIDVVHVGGPETLGVPAGPRVQFAGDVSLASPGASGDNQWLSAWQSADRLVSGVVGDQCDGASAWDVARIVAAAVPAGGLLWVGSSSPIRDLDLVARPYPVGERRYIGANRGLSGIDGTLSTAIGAALARPAPRALAYIGDLTFLHGSNGLLIGPDEPQPNLTIIVAADDGGSIFATLEQGQSPYAEAFERVFATPTGADIAALCAAYGVAHRVVHPAGLADALAESSTGPACGIDVVEVPIARTNRRDDTARMAEIALRALQA